MPTSVLLLSMLLAQPDPNEPPEAFRPLDFSNIVGKYAKPKVSAEPTEAQVEGAIILRVEISGVGPAKYHPNRKDVRLFPDESGDPTEAAEWRRDFYRQELIDQHELKPDKKTWVFVYRLRPKHVKVKQIDGIHLSYYDPSSTDEKKYFTEYADPIPIKVTRKPDDSEKVEVDPVAVPSSFFAQDDASAVLAKTSDGITAPGWLVAVLLGVPPLACFAGVIFARRWFPDETVRVQRYRASAAHRAIEELRSGGASAREVVSRYLLDRLDFAVEDPTPAEVAAFLKRRGVALDVCRQAQAFFEACDAIRFTGIASNGAAPSDDAVRLIQALEADPCV